MGLSLYSSCLALGAVFAVGLFRAYTRNMGLPIIGNLLGMPVHEQWVVFGEWSKTYGDIMHLNVLGQSIIDLSSTRRTTDLMEKRSLIYSDRPRMPMLNELIYLPYVNALIMELLRWHNSVPLGVAHMSTSDDEYDGYFIPKGSIILGNAWFILHNPEIYDQPSEFRPERFLKDGEIDLSIQSAEVAAFGYGRRKPFDRKPTGRICPGRHFADNSLYSLVSSVLSVFTISPAKDEHGNAIPIRLEVTSGFLSYPVHFDCEIKPRSAAAEKLIRDSQEF
ncbi:cytochrome P450 [Infundibulicybe gibba]|nr:cytochrome P450 [Infundibulicybe gibba]